jgi:amidase
MARSVADAAALLSAITGMDARDAATQASAGKSADYSAFLDAKGLQGARIGVARNHFGRSDLVRGVVETALTAMREQGATLVDVEMPAPAKYRDAEFEILLFEFKADLNAYLAEFAAGAEAHTLADLIIWNKRHEKKVMPFFGQEHFESAEAKGTLEDPAYRAALETIQKVVREGIDKLLADQKLDALVAPTAGTGWLTDFVNGDSATGGFSSPAATAGYPHVTVPAGFVHGLPVGVSFVGAPWSEGALIKLAYAYEQATRKRRAPKFARSIAWPEGA